MTKDLFLAVVRIGGNVVGGIWVQDDGTVVIPKLNSSEIVSDNVAEGAALNVADGGTIPHGLAHVPTVYFVEATITGEYARVSAVDGTNLTVAIKKLADDTAGTTQTIMYRARYIP